MTDLPTVSVIVVSRHRPEALLRCLMALRQQDHPALEVIVVTDPDAARLAGATLEQAGLQARIFSFDEANVSAARNMGIAAAAGEVVAFIDDDAVAEPTWASRLAGAFLDAPVVAATGFVRGRNGISFQWRASEVDALGRDHPLAVPAGVSLHRSTAARAVKTQGTNCGFRRATLLTAGGFDPAFRFYLDEADLNLRLAGRGLTAVVPDAQVHHGFASSERRRSDRVPLSLHEIGASSMVFIRRHTAKGDWALAMEHLRHDQKARALRLMVAGSIEPRDVEILLHSLEAGVAEGAVRSLLDPAPIAATELPFLPLGSTGRRSGRVIAGRFWQRDQLRAKARAAAEAGEIATVLCLSPSALYHRHTYCIDGYWWQSGGLWGRSERSGPLLRHARFAERIKQEAGRLAALRPVACH